MGIRFDVAIDKIMNACDCMVYINIYSKRCSSYEDLMMHSPIRGRVRQNMYKFYLWVESRTCSLLCEASPQTSVQTDGN